MNRRFRSKTFVIRKKYLFLCPVISAGLVFAAVSGISVPQSMQKPLFRSVLLCMDKDGRMFSPDYKSLLKSGSIAFAYNPPNADMPEKVSENQEPVQPEQPAAEEAVVQAKYLTIPSTGIEMRNQTSFAPDTAALLNTNLDFLPVDKNSPEPQVLLFHTHTTESYAGCDRTDNEELNVVAVGKVIAEYLNSRGINTLHCKTVHDYDYNGSYSKSYETVEKLLAENPSVKVVLDVHRDGITYEDGSGLRVISEVNGKTAGQFMLVVGTDEGGLYHPGWQTNLSFGLKLQNRMNQKYPGLARPLNLRQERFNQSLSPGMLIVECGGNGNSLEEVKYGAELFADALYDVISQ